MRPGTIIRPFIAACLMLVFALGITPQRTLHNIFGCHKDVPVAADTHDIQVKTHKLSCSCNQADLQAPFVAPVTPFAALLARPAANTTVYNILSTSAQRIYHHALRGPPALITG